MAWGTPDVVFPAAIRAAYVDALRGPAHVHAICEEYRAAAAIDREHDRADRAAGHRIACPVFALWARGGALDTWYADMGGPLGVWRGWADDVRGHAVDGGHFFPEQDPEATAATLREFLVAVSR
jgi:haloacetate dehalogenase